MLVTTCLYLVVSVFHTMDRSRPEIVRQARPYWQAMRALIFDLDGTLVDTVYAHVFAWQQALVECGLPVDGWRIHRRVGMRAACSLGRSPARSAANLTDAETELLQRRHGEIFRELLPDRGRSPAPSTFWRRSERTEIPHGIATSGRRPEIDRSLEALGVRHPTSLSSSEATSSGPSPNQTSSLRVRSGWASRSGIATSWATPSGTSSRRRRAGMLSVGLMTGGYGEDELRAAGAFRVYRDAQELMESLDELGIALGPQG